jgi:pimeloyl-ACP methyl ester carboxylesterase
MRARHLPLALLAIALAAALPATAGARTVWLCKPGLKLNPCTPALDTTRFSPAGEKLGVEKVRRAQRPKVDCFYVYPTVSDQPTPAATRRIDPELRSIALYQAARYSRDCRVFAPVYRQITLSGLFNGGVTQVIVERAYADVLAAWRDYLRLHNRGRGFVLIGHSQGTFELRRLIAEEIERNPGVRRRLVSALLLGGNVMVRAGEDAGGDFDHVRACRSDRQLGCVVAFSTFNAPVPADARFGRAAEPGLEVLCTNPGALGGGEGLIDPVTPRAPFAPGTTIAAAVEAIGFLLPAASTPWLAFPGSYSARCSSEAGAHVLQITPVGGAQVLNPSPDTTWGLHGVDANIALGNLTRLVRRQAAAYVRSR